MLSLGRRLSCYKVVADKREELSSVPKTHVQSQVQPWALVTPVPGRPAALAYSVVISRRVRDLVSTNKPDAGRGVIPGVDL